MPSKAVDAVPAALRYWREKAAPRITANGLLQIAGLLRHGEVSSVEVVDAFLREAAARNGPLNSFEANGFLNAYIRLYPEEALAAAEAADRQLRSATDVPTLCGVPVSVKDAIAIAGKPLTVGTRAYRDNLATGDAGVVNRLRAGWIPMLGHAQADAFLDSGGTKQTANPWNYDHIPSGSSGGSAAAVASRISPGSVGTDTKGSITAPSAACGVTGLRPSHGLVSRFGVFPGIPSFDVVGTIARTACDASALLFAIAGADDRDLYTRVRHNVMPFLPLEPPTCPKPLAGARVGVALNDFVIEPSGSRREIRPAYYGYDEDACAVFLRFLGELADLGADVVTFERPQNSVIATRAHEKIGLAGAPASEVVCRAELYAPSVLERLRRDVSELTGTDRDLVIREYGDPDDQELRAEIDSISSDEYEAATADIDRYRRTYLRTLREQGIHVVAAIHAPCSVPKRSTPDTLGLRTEDETLGPCFGWPVLSVPAGFDRLSGCPIGVQLLAPRFHDHLLLYIAAAHQAQTDYATRSPSKLAP